jgi:hypothetical protein
MDPAARSLIARLHEAPFRYVLAATGGGTAAAGWLLSVPGGSRTVLEVVVPYGEEALREFLGRQPASFCSADTARAMARRAQQRARWLDPGGPAAGVGCTASLRSDRPKHGDHRFHLGVQTPTAVATWSLTLAKGQREREGEEDVLDRVLLNALAESFGVAERVAVPLLPGEEVRHETPASTGLFASFLAGALPVLCREGDGRLRADAPPPGLLLPGSFNPVHDGHRRLAEVAARLVGRPAAFELSITNADKPPLDTEEVRRRMEQFTWGPPLWLTHAPTFAEKARLFPGAVFAVGADTAERIVQPRFYQDSGTRMAEALATVRAHGCRFLVAGRADAAGTFRGLDDLGIPPAWRDLFAGIPAGAFRADVSSTQLRASSAPAPPAAGD